MGKKYKLSGVGRAVLLLLVLAIGGSIFWFGIRPRISGFSFFERDSAEKPNSSTVNSKPSTTQSAPTPEVTDDGDIMTVSSDTNAMNISLDEFVGYAPIIQANGGYTTTPNSIYGKLGLNLNISIINDPTTSSNALIKGDLDGAGYTENRVAFLSNKFADSNVDIVFPIFTSYSAGADGIIATSDITSVRDLIDKKVGAPQFGESQAMLVWLINESDDMTEQEKMDLINSIILFNSAEETGEAFFAGQIDAAATWQPYLDMAKTGSNHVLFDTKAAKTFIMSGVIFRKDYAEAHRDDIIKFIRGFYQAAATEWDNYDTLRGVMPMFAEMSDDEIRLQMNDVEFTYYGDNKTILSKTAPDNYVLQCRVWQSIGEDVDPEFGLDLFDKSYNEALKDEFTTTHPIEKTEALTDEQVQTAIDYPALLTKRTTINFLGDMAVFSDEEDARNKLNDFVATAKILNGALIEIQGNINAENETEFGKQLSLDRAKAVKDYFVHCGIDENRIITVGNGCSNLLVPVGSQNDYLNRRTDVLFKIIEGDHGN